jgi:hypothetical protein
MPRPLPEAGLLLLDACCLLNLCATGRTQEIVACLPYRCATSRFVATREILSLVLGGEGDEPPQREVISPNWLESIENLGILDLQSDEEISQFVRFAMELDDGEASVCALALTRGGGVATDDRKALRILAHAAPSVPTLQTPELLHEWAQRLKVPENEISAALHRVQRRGRFYPRRDAPKFDWWEGFFASEKTSC